MTMRVECVAMEIFRKRCFFLFLHSILTAAGVYSDDMLPAYIFRGTFKFSQIAPLPMMIMQKSRMLKTLA